MRTKEKVALIILDGWGERAEKEWNAIAQGATPTLDRLREREPMTLIDAAGAQVGLPAGQMGNSEVGHLNIGAGRVVYQDISRIYNAIEDGSLAKNKVFAQTLERARNGSGDLRFIGLLSDGGVHSHIDHLEALVDIAISAGVEPERIFIEAITDGRDTPPDSALGYIEDIETRLDGKARIASVAGRFYAMDRDKRWDRVERGWRALALGEGRKARSARDGVALSYREKVTDEFIEPIIIVDQADRPIARRSIEDELIMFNFRADRMKEIVAALTEEGFDHFDRSDLAGALFSVTTMTRYDAKFETIPVLFDQEPMSNLLGKIMSERGLRQLRIAETEKYAHVTFFFNGGIEAPDAGEDRELIPSPRVRTYDLQPQMSAPELTDKAVELILTERYDLIALNIANGDMVGHTGVWEAALDAVATVDQSLSKLLDATERAGYTLIITADHGNIEQMRENGSPMTAHTTNKVPFHLIARSPRPRAATIKLRSGGRLADIAPTILDLMGIDQPEEMTGQSLIENS